MVIVNPLRHAPESDQPFSLDLHAVSSNEDSSPPSACTNVPFVL